MDNPIWGKIRIPIEMGIPKTISVACPARAPYNIVHISISWDEGCNIRVPAHEDRRLKGVDTTGWSRRADTSIRIILPAGTDPQQIEDWISIIGWRLGAGYMYRWSHAPGNPRKHCYGLSRYTSMGEDSEYGDRSPDLADRAERDGNFSWEINCAWKKSEGASKIFWESWLKCDPTLNNDGGRKKEFPGWDGNHPWEKAEEKNTGFESHFYFCKTFRGHGKNKHEHRERGAVYTKDVWK